MENKITRDQYVSMVNSGNYNMEIIYEYYNIFNIKEELKFDFNNFVSLINHYFNMVGTNGVITSIRNYYDSIFNIVTFTDKEGKNHIY
jgi:hypothetical protein